METEVKPIMLILSNLSALLGIVIGFWFAHVGMGYGRGSSVDGDAIFGSMILIAGLLLSLVFLVIGLSRKEGNAIYCIFPVVSIVGFCIYFYKSFKETDERMERTKRYNLSRYRKTK